MKRNSRLFKLVTAVLSIAVILCAVPASLTANAAVYGEYFDLTELVESIEREGTQAVPVIKEINILNDEVAMYDKFEVRFDVDATWTNPYDPDEIQVDGVFTYPSGKEVTIPGFFMTPMVPSEPNKLNMHYGLESANYDPEYEGKSCWALRFAGDEEGDYSFYITVKDAAGNSSKSTSYDFSCYDAGNKGYAKVSEQNPEYLVNSYDNTPYYATGVNIPWVRGEFTKNPLHQSYNYFIGKAKGNTNMTRIWICHYNWLEWKADPANSSTWGFAGGLGYYNQVMGCSFDNILAECEKAGLRIILTLEDNDEHYGDGNYGNWKWNPYSATNGGPAADTTDYFRNDAVREQYKKRLRYMIARWGYSPAIFSFNMWNDMQSTDDPEVIEYHKVLRDYAHSLTDGWRPFLYGSNFNYGVNEVLDYTVQVPTHNDGTKPYITQECYADIDNLRQTLRNSIWSDLVGIGAAGTMYWSQDEVDLCDEGKGCWDVYDHVLDFTADFPFDTTGKFTSGLIKGATATAVNSDADFQTITEVKSYGDVGGWGHMPTENQFTVDTTVAGMNLQGYSNVYYGSKWEKNPPTFTIDVPNGGQVLVEVPESSNGALTVAVDGVIKAEQNFIGPDGTGGRFLVEDNIDSDGNGKPDRFTFVDIPAGTHKVTIDNSSVDWFSAKVYFIANSESPAAMLSINSMVSDSAAMVYINNTTYSLTAEQLLGNKATDFTDVKFDITGLKEDGKYAMYQFDPDSGEYGTIQEVTVSGGKVSVTIPSVKKDYAVKLMKLKDGETVGEGSTYEYLQLVSESTVNDPADGGDGSDNGNDGADDGAKPEGGFPWIVIVIVVVVVAAGAVAFLLISKKKKAAAPAEEKPEDKE